MTIETKTSEKGRISYFGNGSQTRLGTIVDGLIGGETYEIINLNGDRKIFAGYTSKTKKEIAAFIKAPKADKAVEDETEQATNTVNTDLRELIIGEERITFESGHSGNVSSDKYGASFTYAGEYRGFFRVKFNDNEKARLVTKYEFFKIMEQRGACTIDEPTTNTVE